MTDQHNTAQKQRKEGPGYHHTDLHVEEYERSGIESEDNEIGRAWARLYDRGHNAGPAISKPYNHPDGTERQLFLYAYATRDISASNINRMVVFTFGPATIAESGLGHEVNHS